MIPSKVNGTSTAIPNSAIHMISIVQHGDVYMEISNNNHESRLSTNQNNDTNFKVKLSRNRTEYLSVETVRKMISRFLSEKQISTQELADTLGITKKSLLRICSSKFSMALISKINLPLVKLYCRTKF